MSLELGGAQRRLTELLERVRPAAKADRGAVLRRLDSLTKPPGSLGQLEHIALRLALIAGDPPPPLRRRAVFVLAADHGVARRGVSAYPPEVTAQMCRNFGAGGAAINAIGDAVGAEVVAVDIGVDSEEATPGVLDRKVRRASRDLSAGPALTPTEVEEAMLVGAALVLERANDLDAVALGEMGIGNTTAAAAVGAALTGRQATELVGPGTGVEGERLAAKAELVRGALRRIESQSDPLAVLAEVGGLEIAGLSGLVLAAAACGVPVVTDGFIATAAALAAVRMRPSARDYLFASHRSQEPGHAVLLAELGLRPFIDLEMRLGEGTGAALAFPVLEAAAAVLREMATFDSAGIAGPA